MKNKNTVVVGIFVFSCLLLFAVGLFLIGNSNQLFTRSFELYAEFSRITGIVKGGKVRVAGMDAGTITSIEVPSRPEAKFRVHFRIIESLHPIVRQDSVASVQTDGLLGNKYLQIDTGTSEQPVARNKSGIRATEPFDWGNLAEEISGAVKQVNVILAGAKEQLSTTLQQIEDVSKSANLMIKGATPKVQSILVSADKISANLGEILDGVEQGEGAVGALFKDQEMQASVKRSVKKAENVVDQIGQSATGARKIVDRVEASDIVPEVEKTVKNLQQITVQLKAAVEKFQGSPGEGGVSETLQRTLAGANEAMSDLSDNTEALKHNFFFRGFFKRRGFYDLGALTTAEYEKANFAKGFKKYRVWLDSADLYVLGVDGSETLSANGKLLLDKAMTDALRFPRNGPLMIEGFPGAGSSSQQYLQARQRAMQVERYLIARFKLRPAYVGVVSMNAEAQPGAIGRLKEGVGIVSYYK
jgi:phospholipid/cholesterol/gamma-HCH transport system substrate-binding protein